MSKSLFTPGPWKVHDIHAWMGEPDEELNEDYHWQIENKNSTIASIYSEDAGVNITAKQSIANARLIAAAPEMYHLLEQILKYDDASSNTNKVITALLTRINPTP